ncbi:hypothetical protein PoB_003501600 [Plakobranchus ocellatus]|uniref:Uncharacterized protein n=1 Tax=Plakobranchus ocellatus TaxID=259542 RepID=A0AAV4AJP6_9GAST|nr:hypothetical protein PoB_003501600 [Plakobranchus ocellatus]
MFEKLREKRLLILNTIILRVFRAIFSQKRVMIHIYEIVRSLIHTLSASVPLSSGSGRRMFRKSGQPVAPGLRASHLNAIGQLGPGVGGETFSVGGAGG